MIRLFGELGLVVIKKQLGRIFSKGCGFLVVMFLCSFIFACSPEHDKDKEANISGLSKEAAVELTETSVGCLAEPALWKSMAVQSINLLVDGKTTQLEGRIADEIHEQREGYQWLCPEQAYGTTMLFKFDREISTSFHMRNVYTPLMILFFDAQGVMIERMQMQPEANRSVQPRYYNPGAAFQYALEVASGDNQISLLQADEVHLNLAAGL